VYPHYVAKAERKGRTKREVNKIIYRLTGYSMQAVLQKEVDFATFFKQALELNLQRKLITGVVCGVRVEDVKEHPTQEIRYLDIHD